MCILLTMKANTWSRWPCFCQGIMHFTHSGFGGNDPLPAVHWPTQLQWETEHAHWSFLFPFPYYGKKFLFLFHNKFIVGKKFPYFVFLALFCYKGFPDTGPKALILKHYEQVHQTLRTFGSKFNGKAELGIDKSAFPTQPTHNVGIETLHSAGSTEMNFKKRLNCGCRPKENCSAISRLPYRLMHQEICPGLATKTLLFLRISQKFTGSSSKKEHILKLQLLQGLNTGVHIIWRVFSENNILISTLTRAPHLLPA